MPSEMMTSSYYSGSSSGLGSQPSKVATLYNAGAVVLNGSSCRTRSATISFVSSTTNGNGNGIYLHSGPSLTNSWQLAKDQQYANSALSKCLAKHRRREIVSKAALHAQQVEASTVAKCAPPSANSRMSTRRQMHEMSRSWYQESASPKEERSFSNNEAGTVQVEKRAVETSYQPPVVKSAYFSFSANTQYAGVTKTIKMPLSESAVCKTPCALSVARRVELTKTSVPEEYLPEVILDRTHFHYAWITEDYLQFFYDKVEDLAMQMILTYLPSLVYRLPPGGRLLDVGAGPTIHVAVAFRKNKDEIYLSDYLPQNRDALNKWLDGTLNFNWINTLKFLALREGLDGGLERQTVQMEAETRPKVKGIVHCDVHEKTITPTEPIINEGFEVVTSLLCLEYCCNREQEYRDAIKNCVRAVKPNGHFVMGSVMESNWCGFGGRHFTCLYVTEQLILDCLTNAGIDTDPDNGFIFYNHNGIFLTCGRKMTTKEYAAKMIKQEE